MNTALLEVYLQCPAPSREFLCFFSRFQRQKDALISGPLECLSTHAF